MINDSSDSAKFKAHSQYDCCSKIVELQQLKIDNNDDIFALTFRK
jgi:hypothetical protein